MPVPGEMLGDRYRLDDRIAEGGMGEVWQATDTVLGRDVAIKTLHAARAGDPGFQTRFRHEARAMAVLHHPGVADVYDYGQTGDGAEAYIVMARIEGQALNQRIAERGRLTPAETMSIVAQAGRALDAAHQAGIVHRDVKPGNLIIKPDGTVVLVDFGVARSAESAALTGAKEVVGTALYIAPEQVSKDVTGPLADVYALGVVAYHCLAGHPPFFGDSAIAVAMQHLREEPPPLPDDVPEPVRQLVARAMAKDPADRFPSAAAMAAAAEQTSGSASTTAILAAPVAGGETAALRPATRGDTAILPATQPAAPGVVAPEPGPRRPLLIAAIALLVLGVAGAVLAFVAPGWLVDDDKPPPTSVTNSTGVSAPPSKAGGGEPTQTQRTQRTRTATTAPAGGGTDSDDPEPSPSQTSSRTPTPTQTTSEPEETTTTTGGPATTTGAAEDPGNGEAEAGGR